MEDGIRKLGRRDGEGGHVASVLDVLDLLLSYMCAQIRVWSCLVTDNFGLFTENSCVVGVYGALCPRPR